MKTCNICGQEKPVSEYYLQLGKPMKRCKDCQRSYARQWAEINKDNMLKTRAKYNNSKYRTKQVREARADQRLANVERTA